LPVTSAPDRHDPASFFSVTEGGLMRRTYVLLSYTLGGALLACGDAGAPTDPLREASRELSSSSGQHVSHVNILDACDPTTFNAALGAGTCTRPGGGVTFEQFIAELTKHKNVASWRFAPQLVQTRVGDLLVAINKGGEAHTFTEVEAFGGGFVAQLNALAGLTEIAPECLLLGPGAVLAPDDRFSEEVGEEGTELYQCCIHPWMRATVVAR
jgi:hypothetical protein